MNWPSTGAMVFAGIGALVFLVVLVGVFNYLVNKKFKAKFDELLDRIKK